MDVVPTRNVHCPVIMRRIVVVNPQALMCLLSCVCNRVRVSSSYYYLYIVTDEHQKNLTLNLGKKLLRKNFNNTCKEIKLYSSNAYSIDYSSNTLSRNNAYSNIA